MSSRLITGGARSGKSRYAQHLAEKSGGRVLFVATAVAGDEEMRRRIEQHRRERPSGWRTLEAATGIGREIPRALGDAELVIVDCITLLVSNVILKRVDEAGVPTEAAATEREVSQEIRELLDCIERADADFVIVTNEVGLGIVPANLISRLYRDLLGRANQMLAGAADEVVMMIAGLPMQVKPAKLQ